MQPISQMSDLQYLLQPNLSHMPCDYSNNIITEHSQNASNPQYQVYTTSPQWQEVSPKWTSLSSNSTTSDEAEVSILKERKQRRMLSNRESARRSRLRKQRHLDELRSQLVAIRNENQNLKEKLNNSTQDHHCLLQQNSQLKDEVSKLREMLTHMHLNTTTP